MSDSATVASNPFSDDNFDPRPSDAPSQLEPSTQKKVAVIRTSDRILFKRCRRRWGWGSHLRQNLGGKQAASPLWLGSGFHFAMEDFHGQNVYGHPIRALDAYVFATKRKGGEDALPYSWREDWELGRGMLAYYADHWLRNRQPLETFIFDGQPQVEVNFRILIPFDAYEWGYDEVVYSGTLDRVVIDENGILWILEYKTAKQIVTNHFQTDPQVTSYCWAASILYPGYSIGGVIYQQHLKTVPDEPKMLATGKLSTDKRQATDYHMYRETLRKIYGDLTNAPTQYLDTLNHFASLESQESNKFVRRDRLYRNRHQMEAEGQKILLEVGEMLNPDLDLYPNPTRDCSFCGFIGPCVSMDDGSQWEEELEAFNQPREASYDSWRKYLPAASPRDSSLNIFMTEETT